MKKEYILKGLAGLMAVAMMSPALTSCKEDYLDLEPITSISKADVANTLDGARFAMQGACSSMYRQMRTNGWNNTCGEPYMCMMYGEGLGNNYHDRIWDVYGSVISNWNQMRTASSMTANYMWCFQYGLINAANQVLDVIDEVPTTDDAEEAERISIKAALLALRSHSYIRLLQTYGPRWEDASNGTANAGVVLRLSASTEDVPFSTVAEVVAQINKDLDESIRLFGQTSYKRDLIWVPDVNVAHGLKARIAAITHDWSTCRSEAKAARQGHEIMTAEQYVKGGFVQKNQEYLWATWFQSEGIYYDGHGGTYSCNGWTVWTWGTSTAIDFDLYRKIPLTDCRKGIYMAPGGFLELNKDLVDEFNNDADNIKYGLNISDASFFDPTIVDASTCTINLGDNQSLAQFVNWYAMETEKWPDNNTGMEWSSGYSGGAWPYYAAKYLVAGLQYKFWSVDTFSTNQFPFMRASEMAYLEAEAAYMLGDEQGARDIMIEINLDKRDPDFTCTETGTALLDKIKAYRHIELWGEGFTWFDYKRWNQTMTRSKWVDNDPTSGNWQEGQARDFAPDFKEGWRCSVPTNEFNYNKAIDEKELPSSNR